MATTRTPATPTVTRITLRENADNLFADAGDTSGVDLEASTERFLELLADEARAAYPDAVVSTIVTGAAAPLSETNGPTPRFLVEVSDVVTPEEGADVDIYDECLDVLREAVGELYGDWERWLVYSEPEA